MYVPAFVLCFLSAASCHPPLPVSLLQKSSLTEKSSHEASFFRSYGHSLGSSLGFGVAYEKCGLLKAFFLPLVKRVLKLIAKNIFVCYGKIRNLKPTKPVKLLTGLPPAPPPCPWANLGSTPSNLSHPPRLPARPLLWACRLSGHLVELLWPGAGSPDQGILSAGPRVEAFKPTGLESVGVSG